VRGRHCAEVQDAIGEAGSDLNAVRIRTRASMGNCQGGFCTHRIAAELAQEYPEPVVRDAEDELYQERWKASGTRCGDAARRRC